jgi:hypothetical protein
MATKQKTPETEPTVRVRASLAFDNLRRGDELETALTPRVQTLIDSGRLVLVQPVETPTEAPEDLPE